jgi:HSP20 family molecular chaperone IbpA
MRKRSFFEKLTGTIRMDDNDYADEYEQENHEDDSELTEDVIQDEVGQLAVDVYETSDAIVVQAMTAGVNKTHLDITLNREQIMIEGERHPPIEIDTEQYHYQELYWGKFSRMIDLPAEVNIEEADASEQHGLLTIKLPKTDKHKQTRLKVKNNQS